MTVDTIWVISPPDDYLEVILGIKRSQALENNFDWVTDELGPETDQVVQIFDHMEQDGEQV